MSKLIENFWLESVEKHAKLYGEDAIIRLVRQSPNTANLYINDALKDTIDYPNYCDMESYIYKLGYDPKDVVFDNSRSETSTYIFKTKHLMEFNMEVYTEKDEHKVWANIKLTYLDKSIMDIDNLICIHSLFEKMYIKWCEKYDSNNNLKWK